MTGLTLAHAK